MKKEPTYGWVCSWTNGKGCFHPDAEWCRKSRKGYKTPESAARAGQKHVQSHGWGERWGYPTRSNWRDSYIYVVKYYPLRKNQKPWNQKKESLGQAAEVLERESNVS